MQRIIKYNTELYKFKEQISSWFSDVDLSKLHTLKQYEHFERENDQSTIWHKKFYEMILFSTLCQYELVVFLLSFGT